MNNDLRNFRQANGVPVTDLAECAGITRMQYYRIEKGLSVPSVLVAIRITKYYCRLITGTDSAGFTMYFKQLWQVDNVHSLDCRRPPKTLNEAEQTIVPNFERSEVEEDLEFYEELEDP